ncbi:MAG: hypothetical protein ACMVO5_05075 [Polymorphobacter sp.]|uniref:hypothetical protein n=1 Tax=Polymorphobacter sp. TaxID=1909290 RepID=UPI003A87FE05
MNRFLISVALVALSASPAAAQRLSDTFSLQAAVYFPGVDSRVRVDATNGTTGSVVDFENDLGFDTNRTLPAFMAEWRPGDDWVLNAEYYAIGRENSTTIDRELTVGDTVYPVNASVRSGFDSDIIRFTVGNRFYQTKNFELGAAIGLHGTDFSIFIEGEGAAGGQAGQFQSENRSVFAPLPTIGAFFTWEPAPKLSVNGRVDWLSLTIGEYSGRLVNTEISAAYRIQKNIDIGAMYRFVDYRVRVNRDDWEGEVRYNFNGPAIFVQFGF